ncbi:YD repeat-containing protein [Chryseobacterium oleae]|uniref:YD repeat-containing protein n=1 Tax=Chryseobacterium oleae TaxID=491207 RepID=A0A1I4XSI8_CHROL|nr:RHS repeat domain-containing protein [Chryseobacterium oleae]SFN28249.1 YD repeat-containing protein [Chryseobacterium oleae]
MKKILLLCILIFNWGLSQRNFGDTSEPMPSVSSFSSYVNTPVSLSTGIPNISVPLFSLPSGHSGVDLSAVLNYHAYNAISNKPGSEVGLGWSLLKGGVISRVINGMVDEELSNPNRPNYKKNIFDDIYYYDIPGESGKFKFVRDTLNNTFTLNNISGNNIKIDYTRDSNTATLILNSFTLTNDKGIKYIFEDYSVSRYNTGAAGFNYKSAFFLTKIIDENNLTVADFSYQKNTKYSGNVIIYQNCKLGTISTKYGKMAFEYSYSAFMEDAGKNDPYELSTVSLSDAYSHLISKYRLQYSTFSVYQGTPDNGNQGKRILTDIKKLDKNERVIEARTLEYDRLGSETNYSPSGNPNEYGNFLCPVDGPKYPGHFTLGLLKKMILPEGGYVEYNFEAGEMYRDSSQLLFDTNQITQPDVQYLNLVNTADYDTNISRNYTFQVTETKKFFVTDLLSEVYTIHDIHGDIVSPPVYKLMNSGGAEMHGYAIYKCDGIKYYNLTPGTYTFKIKGNGNGTIKTYAITSLPQPYKNTIQREVPRIATIKYYTSILSLKKTITYQYNSFTNPNDSSGQEFFGESCDGDYATGFILYRNVKEIYGGESENIGYSKYYFKTPDDYTSGGNVFYRPYYNIVSSGILTKKEVFSQQNQLMSDENMEYVFDEISNLPEYTMCAGYRSKASWMKSSKTTSKTYYDNGSSLQNITETFSNPANLQTSLIKDTSSEGKVTEKKISYAADMNNIRLTNANMMSIPIQTEVKVNGTLVNKSETKYDSSSNLYPSSVIEFNMQNQSPITAATLDIYDDKGNLVQASNKVHIPTTTIWGYYQTQPIAKIEGLPYSQVMNLQTVIAAVNASNADADNPANESSLLLALENLKKDPVLKNYSVTTSTYDPLIGITNSISANGIKTTYLYDSANRLIKITDASGKTLSEYQYNYKTN